MFSNGKRFHTTLAPMLLGVGLAVIAVSGCQAGSAAGPIHCQMRAETSGGMTSLEGIVHADRTVSGSYRLRVKSSGASGSSSIDQGGDFTAGPGTPATLGTVTLSGARFDASLTVTVDGRTTACTDGIGRI